jgi:hypothetical protein
VELVPNRSFLEDLLLEFLTGDQVSRIFPVHSIHGITEKEDGLEMFVS